MNLLDYAVVISFHVLISHYQPVVGPQLSSFISLTPRVSPLRDYFGLQEPWIGFNSVMSVIFYYGYS